MRLGLQSEGWRTIFANDFDTRKEEIYRANFPDSGRHFVLGDINGLSHHEIPTVALATASFPCNDLSLAGSREGLKGKNSSAFWGFVRLLDTMPEQRRPQLLLIENVPGFLSSNDGKDFENAMLVINDLGYAVDPFILDAANFVPQSRQRLFILCRRIRRWEKIGSSVLLEETPLRPKALTQFILCHPTIKWSIRSLPLPPLLASRLEDVLDDVPPDASAWWNQERAAYLLNQMSEKHRAIANKMIVGSASSFGTVFRRVRNKRSMAELRTDGIAGCLRTPRGGSGRQILFKAGRGSFQVRLLTARECARLMGADEFKIEVPLNQALFGFGDAVCVPVIQWIAKHYLNPVWKLEYGPTTKDSQTTIGLTAKARA